jgi:hypothetical protein
MFPASVLAKHLTSVISNKRTDPSHAPQGAVRHALAFFELAKKRTKGPGTTSPFVEASFHLVELLVASPADVPRMLGVYTTITSRLVTPWMVPDAGLVHFRDTQTFFERLHKKGQDIVQRPSTFGQYDGTAS